MKIALSSQALTELIEVREYIARDKPQAAARVAARIRNSVNRLAVAPRSERTGRVAGTLELVVPGLPYILPYRLQGEAIQILRVLHASQQWPGKL